MGESTSTRGFGGLGLPGRLVSNLERMGYRTPWPIQAQAIPPILEGRDVVGIAQTGRGKTAAFLTPAAARLLPVDRSLSHAQRLRVLVICPTRELASQIASEGRTIVAGNGLRLECVYGKVAIGPQIKRIRDGVDILVGTPGRLRELVEADAIDLTTIRTVVLDEADRMLDMGFRPQVDRLLQRTGETRQTLLFTATMPRSVEELAARYLRDAEHVAVDPETTPVAHVNAHLVEVADRDKVPLLVHLLEHRAGMRKGGTLVFCATRRRVGWVGAALRRNGLKVGTLHGDRSQKQRADALASFTAGDLDLLVATDVASRGLHIERVRTVVNYDIPPAAEDYVHRVGRAAHGTAGRRGRGSGRGDAYSFLSHYDADAWERVVDRTLEVLIPEEIDGFVPSVTPRGVRGKPSAVSDEARIRRSGTKTGGPDAWRKKRARKGKSDPTRGRGRKSRPISKGERPGGGVRRPDGS